MSNLYGRPQVKREDDRTDKIGIRTLVLSQMWVPPDGATAQSEIDAAQPGVPGVNSNLLLIGAQTRQQGGAQKTTWTFEGVAGSGSGNGKTVEFKDRTKSLDFGFEPGFAQVSIKLHPEFNQMLEDYSGYMDPVGEVVWAPILTGGGGRSGLSAGVKSEKTNPMFGIQEYFRMEGTYRFRYAELKLPASLNDGAGLIADQLPGEPPDAPDGRNWLKLPPVWHRRGLAFDITEIYWLSGPGGWPEPVYRGKNGRGGGGGFGLRTGSLTTGSL